MKKCLNCEKELTGKQKKYCSKKCDSEHRRSFKENKDKANECQKKYYKENKDVINHKQKIYRDKNKDVIREAKIKYRQDNKIKVNETRRRYLQNNKERVHKYRKKYYQNNKDRILKQTALWSENNKGKVKKTKSKYYKTNIKKPMFHLNHCISGSIKQSLKSKNIAKNGRPWQSLVGYTLHDLREHIEKQFKPGMSWDNHGLYGWHIDHIIPKSFFIFNSTDDVEFKYCWSLDNLQPLWAIDNLRKSDRLLKSEK